MRAKDWRKILESLRDSRLEAPPEELIRKALARMSPELHSPMPTALAGAIEEIARRWSVKLRETWAAPDLDAAVPSPALRGAGVSSPLHFENEDYSLALSLSTGEKDWTLIGQLSPKKESALPSKRQVFLDLDGDLHEVEPGEFGGFRIEGLARPAGEMAIVLEDILMRISLPD